MCGRYTIFSAEDLAEINKITQEINQKYNAAEAARMKTGEIFPTNIVPVLTAGGAELMSWGFPKWDGKGVIINARQETAAEKTMFRKPLSVSRCVVPSTGFYEWKRTTTAKDKYLLRLPNDPVLYMAGFYNEFTGPIGQHYNAFVILTTAANASVSAIHDRMPVILQTGELNTWLTGDRTQAVMNRTGPELLLEAV